MPEPGSWTDLEELDRLEFEALRATIRERGTVRVCVLVITFLVWGALVIALSASEVVPVFSLIGVLMLAAGFEAAFALHVGVERIGRYLQVFYEERLAGGSEDPPSRRSEGDTRPRWESTMMAYGRSYPGAGPDPLLGGLFLLATALNYLLVALVGVTAELIGLGAAHMLLPIRILLARTYAARQRSEELERFRQLRITSERAQSPAGSP